MLPYNTLYCYFHSTFNSFKHFVVLLCFYSLLCSSADAEGRKTMVQKDGVLLRLSDADLH